jgi:hypothetical protein
MSDKKVGILNGNSPFLTYEHDLNLVNLKDRKDSLNAADIIIGSKKIRK